MQDKIFDTYVVLILIKLFLISLSVLSVESRFSDFELSYCIIHLRIAFSPTKFLRAPVCKIVGLGPSMILLVFQRL